MVFDAQIVSSSQLQFRRVAPQGFGDRHNSWAWSMRWWKGKLYVGTNRAWHCAERAGMRAAFPLLIKYPPPDPDAECTLDPSELPLQAEIWCWTPETDEWQRLYQSPRDVPIPGHPGKYIARDVGFRDMSVFVEPNGTEALYVSGVNARFMFRPVPSPRLLRSTDGLTFEPVPQAPGTFLGTLDTCTFRTIAIYKERLFVSTGTIQGDGVVLESSNPAAGNDHFRQISPPGMKVFEMAPFNGHLYFGVRDPKRGYRVVKTDATGALPYKFTPVVTEGGFLSEPSRGILSMQVYQGRLYIGTDRPATEVIRINPDDTWDLIVGTPRKTPAGWKYPLSGLDAGFNNWLNGHIWRMVVHEGRLYIGTWNMGTEFRKVSGADAVLKPSYGFDLYETFDGWHYTPVTLTGFDDKFNYGLRSFASTPYGLFVGTANKWYGLQIWRGTSEDATRQPLNPEAINTGGIEIRNTISATKQSEDQFSHQVSQRRKLTASACLPPRYLEVESTEQSVVLSWEASAETKQFHIWRAWVTDERRTVETNPFLRRVLRLVQKVLFFMPDIYLPPLPDKLWIPGVYEQIGTTEQFYFEDTTSAAGRRSLYYVRAEAQSGEISAPSNLVAVPVLVPSVTFDSLLEMVNNLANQGKSGSMTNGELIGEELNKISASLKSGNLTDVNRLLQTLPRELEVALPGASDSLGWEDLQLMLMKLRRRVVLSQARIIPEENLSVKV